MSGKAILEFLAAHRRTLGSFAVAGLMLLGACGGSEVPTPTARSTRSEKAYVGYPNSIAVLATPARPARTRIRAIAASRSEPTPGRPAPILPSRVCT